MWAQAHLRGVGIIVFSSVRPEAPAGVGLGVQVASAEGLSYPRLPFRQVPEVRRLHLEVQAEETKGDPGEGHVGCRKQRPLQAPGSVGASDRAPEGRDLGGLTSGSWCTATSP